MNIGIKTLAFALLLFAAMAVQDGEAKPGRGRDRHRCNELDGLEAKIEWFEIGDDENCEDFEDDINEIKLEEDERQCDPLKLASDAACFGEGEDDNKCICSRIVLSFFETSYLKSCGSCKMSLVPEDKETERRDRKDVNRELKRAIKKEKDDQDEDEDDSRE